MGDEEQLITCPSSINLIGDQLSYNGGVTIFLTMGKKFTMSINRRNDDKINLKFPKCTLEMYIKDFENINLYGELIDGEVKSLMNAILGELKKNNFVMSNGFDGEYNFDIDSYEKNSTSIAFEVLTLKGINHINGYKLSKYDIENISEKLQILKGEGYKRTSEAFMMSMCEENKSYVLYCQSLKHECISMDYDGYSIIISSNDSLSKKSFEEEKICQCNDALKKFQRLVNISSLCNLSIGEFEKFKGVLDKDTLKVASYVVYENYRIKNMISKFKKGDINYLGIIMKESHDKLKNLYGIVDEKHDFIFNEAIKINGCIGSKISESSLGMCNLSIVKDEYINSFKSNVEENYKCRYDEDLKFYVQSLNNKYRAYKKGLRA